MTNLRRLGELTSLVGAAELRHRWRGLVLLGLLTATWAGVTMSAAAGARRTDSVVDGFLSVTRASDATFAIAGDRDGTALSGALRQRSDVLVADVLWFVGTGLAYEQGAFVHIVAPQDGAWGRIMDRPILLDGRVAEPTDATEVMLTAGAAELLGVEAGDRISIPTWDKHEWEAWLKVRGAYPAFNGPRVDVTVVGIVRTAFDLEAIQEPGLVVVVTPAFLARWGSSIGENNRVVVVSLQDSNVDVDAIANDLTASLGQRVTATTPEDAYASQLRNATSATSTSLWVLAISVGLAGGVFVILGIARELRLAADRYRPLVALGFTTTDRATVLSMPIVVVLFVAIALASFGAGLTSRLFPIGPGRRAEPSPSIRLDGLVLCAGAVLVIVVLAIAMLSTFRSDHQLPSRPSLLGRATAFVDRFGPAASIGRRNATGTRENRLTLAATIVTISGLMAATWFTISLVRLGDDAGRWGYTWSSSPELGFSPDDFEKAVDTTIAHPGVAGIGLVEFSTAVVDERPTSIAVIESLRGSRIEPRILSGQMPRAWREIALGESTARSLGVGVGDVVTVGSVDVEPSEWSVVGLVVPPLSPTTTRPGDGAYTTLTNAAALFPDRIPDETLVALAYAPGVDDRVLETSLAAEPGWVFGARSHARRPGAVANLLGVSVVLWWMVGFFLVFGMCATAACATRRSRRQVHDLVVLRALGFTRRDAVWSALAEATTTVCLGVAVGLPLGFVMGRASWRLSAGELGVDDAQSSVVPVAFATIAVVATVVAGVLVTASRRVLRMRTAAVILRVG